MAVVEGTLNQPLGAAMNAIRHAASNAGYTLAGNEWTELAGAEEGRHARLLGIAAHRALRGCRSSVHPADRDDGGDLGHHRLGPRKRATRRLFDAIGASY